MSPLTKALVVLVTLLSVVMVAVAIPFVAKTDNYKNQVDTLKGELAAARQKASMVEQDIQNIYAKTRGSIAQLTSEKSQLQAQIDKLTDDLSASQKQVSSLNQSKALAEADIARLSASSEQSQTLLSTVTKDLNQARQELLTEKTRAIQLADAQTKLQGEVASMRRQVKRMQEAMVALENENQKLADRAASIPADLKDSASQIVTASKKIQGQVQAIDQVSDVTLVQVNIGSSDGVMENMKFNIHRNGQFVGNMVIETVDATDSAGRVTLLSDGAIQVGDLITAATF